MIFVRLKPVISRRGSSAATDTSGLRSVCEKGRVVVVFHLYCKPAENRRLWRVFARDGVPVCGYPLRTVCGFKMGCCSFCRRPRGDFLLREDKMKYLASFLPEEMEEIALALAKRSFAGTAF